jgi:hypothetical protein
MLLLLPLSLCVASLLAPGDDVIETDTVFLNNGKSLTGRVVHEGDEYLILRKGSRDKEVLRADIQDVDSRVRNLHALLDRLEDIGPGGAADANAMVELARFAESGRLVGEARALYLRALLADPSHEAALAALGCRERKKHWSYKHGSKWYRTDELRTAVDSWKNRWTLESVHFQLLTNTPLDDAINTLIDLERFYRAFFAEFQQELTLLDPDEVLEIHSHGDDKSYPQPSDGRSAWFGSSDRITHLNATRKPWREGLFHEATHHIFHMTTVRSRSGKGSIPPWLDEGLAVAWQTGLRGDLGYSDFDLSSIEARYFREQTGADKPYGFSRVLAFTTGDYFASKNPTLKYAQSYTLVHFLMYGNGGDRREVFMDFLRSAYEGKSSSTDFRDIIGYKSKDKFEEEWFESVAETASRL